ncbi:hypothetical protein [Paraburkholderia sp. SIMBA_054]|uniref:hypothetical protein n=1 Tax=Paraburkholderia sp. SIMBA_054 TaxID=3085795 RepID=UPI00397A1CE0
MSSGIARWKIYVGSRLALTTLMLRRFLVLRLLSAITSRLMWIRRMILRCLLCAHRLSFHGVVLFEIGTRISAACGVPVVACHVSPLVQGTAFAADIHEDDYPPRKACGRPVQADSLWESGPKAGGVPVPQILRGYRGGRYPPSAVRLQ